MSEAENERREEPTPQPETGAQAAPSNCTEAEHDDASPRRRPRPTARRFARSIAMGLLIVSLPAIAAIWTLITPKYTARAEIRVKPIIPWIVFEEHGPEEMGRYESYMNTQVSVMRSPTVLNRVLARPDVRRTQWFRDPYGPILAKLKTPPPAFERLQEDLSISLRRRTELIDVKMTAMKAKDAAVIVNAVVEEYISYCSEKVDENAEMLHRRRVEKYMALDEEIKREKQVLAKLRADLGTSDPEELISAIRVRLEEKQDKLDDVRGELMVALRQYKAIADKALAMLRKELKTSAPPQVAPNPQGESEPKDGRPAKPLSELAIAFRDHQRLAQLFKETDEKYLFLRTITESTDEENRKLRQRLTGVQQRLKFQISDLEERPPRSAETRPTTAPARNSDTSKTKSRLEELRKLRWQLAAVARQLKELDRLAKSRKGDQGRKTPRPAQRAEWLRKLEDARNDVRRQAQEIDLLRHSERIYEKEVDNADKNFKNVFERAKMLRKEIDALAQKQKAFTALGKRLFAAQIERNVPASIEVRSKATVPSEPDSDWRIALTVAALVLGLGAGVAWAYRR